MPALTLKLKLQIFVRGSRTRHVWVISLITASLSH